MNFSWAEDYPEVYRTCSLFNLQELNKPLRFCYKSLPSLIQDGPQCGLVALAMYIGNPSSTIEALFETAKSSGFSNHGEMFSVENMAKLARHHLQSEHIEIYSGLLNTNIIKEKLLDGVHLLVPYDTDKDNSPCLLNGHKAHWAVVCGAAETTNDFYVLARHGKSKNVAVWRLADLSESNAQLNEVGIYHKQPSVVFRLPEGNIDGPSGLKCKCVLLSDKRNCQLYKKTT